VVKLAFVVWGTALAALAATLWRLREVLIVRRNES
jgi:hypothetical protein